MAAEGALQMNIAEIAEMAGVSRAAVSRYFNNGYISREKREAIREVVEKTGYRPSAQAQTLRTKKTNMIGTQAGFPVHRADCGRSAFCIE